jgi:hypothetical protein
MENSAAMPKSMIQVSKDINAHTAGRHSQSAGILTVISILTIMSPPLGCISVPLLGAASQPMAIIEKTTSSDIFGEYIIVSWNQYSRSIHNDKMQGR